jgi:cytochrome P450
VFAAHRIAHRVHWSEHTLTPNSEGSWYLFGYEDCQRALRNQNLVLTASGAAETAHVPEAIKPLLTISRNFLGAMDPPLHTRSRRLLMRAFTQERVAALRPRVEELVDELLDEMDRSAERRVDFVSSFAFPLPMTIIGEVLGVPTEKRQHFRSVSTNMVNGLANPYDPAMVSAATSAAQEMKDFFDELVDTLKRDPQHDFLSAMTEAEEQGLLPFSHEELLAIAIELVLAGHETTVNALSKGILGLLTQRDQYELLCSDPDRWADSTVEEVLRWTTPLQRLRYRYATEPDDIAGQPIDAGDEVAILAAAANRDPDVFTEPDRIDLTRGAIKHLSFGYGMHLCIGAPLARLELQVAFNRLAKKFPDMQIDLSADVSWRPNTMLPGPEALWVLL